MPTADVTLLAATALHAGFQVTITAIVYPALVEVDDASWRAAHERHSSRIVPLVAVVYTVLLAATVRSAVSGPEAAGWAAVAAAGGAVLVTAVAAAPLHGRLTDGDRTLRRRLVVVDRARCGLAVAALLLAGLALLGHSG